MAPDDRRAHLLRAARTVFASLGYHRANVAAIIREAGVARGTFYNYFDSKRSCFQAVLAEMMEGVASAVHPIDVNRDVPLQVRENLERLLQALTEDDEVPRVLFAEAAGIDEEGDEGLRGFYRAATDRLAKAIQTGQSIGFVRHCPASRCPNQVPLLNQIWLYHIFNSTSFLTNRGRQRI